MNNQLFRTGFMYVFLLSANTYCIANLFWIGIAVFSFLISFLWTVNVKSVSVSTFKERLFYATGAMFGGIAGILVIDFINRIL